MEDCISHCRDVILRRQDASFAYYCRDTTQLFATQNGSPRAHLQTFEYSRSGTTVFFTVLLAFKRVLLFFFFSPLVSRNRLHSHTYTRIHPPRTFLAHICPLQKFLWTIFTTLDGNTAGKIYNVGE